MSSPGFLIYNASAGSGKTFTLVKHYLTILFQSNKALPFRHVLALTFTNKAVGEMKDRVLKHLFEFSNPEILNSNDVMFTSIYEEFNWTPKTLQLKSKELLEQLVYNYAAFEISTIDKFNHNIIRTFAHDLKLPVNFEVEIDQNSLLIEAVDSLISKAGTDEKLTEIIINFALEKADDDKSFDVSRDLYQIATLITRENDKAYIDKISDKSLDDFKNLKTLLISKTNSAQSALNKVCTSFFNILEKENLDFTDFSGAYLPKYFIKVNAVDLNIKFDAKWQQKLETDPLYTKTLHINKKEILDRIQPELKRLFDQSKHYIFILNFLSALYKNLTPISVLNAISSELTIHKQVQNKLMISEFNTLIHEEIKNQPTPYIYERLGEKFHHYCLDEFQDTSVMQWQNMIPLIDNAISQEKEEIQGSLLIVGDAKQSIYRWRGGKPEQFINLYNGSENPFQTSVTSCDLATNYRSCKTVVEFNNAFFAYMSDNAFTNPIHADLYKESKQNHFNNAEGLVELQFVEGNNAEERTEAYLQTTLEIIKNCIVQQQPLSSICILVRKNKDAVAVANCLITENIPVVSSESLLLKNSLEVQFIMSFLKYFVNPEHEEAKIMILEFLASKQKILDNHEFFSNYIKLNSSSFFEALGQMGYPLNMLQLNTLTAYELVESLIKTFRLIPQSNAYVQCFLDEVLNFSNKKNTSLNNFVEYFEIKGGDISISMPDGQEAIKIMTIHKSKGLEFDTVIYPFADSSVYKTMNDKIWFPLEQHDFGGFEYAYLNFNQEIANFGEAGNNIHSNYRSQKELDAVNVLYVALTRAVNKLFIISKSKTDEGYSSFFANYLKEIGSWEEGKLTYSFGNSPKFNLKQLDETVQTIQPKFISSNKAELNVSIVNSAAVLWNASLKNAIEKGNLIHDLLKEIKTTQNIESAVEQFHKEGKIEAQQISELKENLLNITEHETLQKYFSEDCIVYNEREIIDSSGQLLRPDRLVIMPNNEAVIIDYKTGAKKDSHKLQLKTYAETIKNMGFKVKALLVLYINEAIEVFNLMEE